MNEIAEDNKRKPKLTVEEQIEHLKSKGVTFELCDEGEASRILSEQDHYFRLAAYRVLFPKRVGGKHDGEYAELDFGQLVDLAGIDQELRRFLLPLTLDVENAAKTKLVEKITDNRMRTATPSSPTTSRTSTTPSATGAKARSRAWRTTPTSDRSSSAIR